MNFVDISSLGITTSLNVLKRDTQRYSTFIYQHQDTFFADNNRIGNNNQEIASQKFFKVLSKSIDENISLVISPEYSCPKVVIDEILSNNNFRPKVGKLWALGGESLDKEDLDNLKQFHNDDVHLVFEDCYSDSDNKYVDPLYYIFNGQHNGNNKLIILIQFKSRHMGGLRSSSLEADNLIEGNDVYIIKNNNTSIKLMSFICSQAINFTPEYLNVLRDEHNWIDSPFLILSLQFNPQPSHRDFVSFKKFVLEKNKKELITLNWGVNTVFTSGKNLYQDINSPRSAIYFKTTNDDLDYSDSNIINNHNKGLYFLQILREKRAYFFNGNIDLFKIFNKPVSIDEGQDPQQRREGPKVENIYRFNENNELIENINIDDNHINELMARGIQNLYLLRDNVNIIDKERLLDITNGNVNDKDKWSSVISLNSFRLNEENECNNRLTYLEDTLQESENVRQKILSNFIEVDQTVLINPDLYPESIKHLKNKELKFSYSDEAKKFNYKYNVVNGEGNLEKATICYLGAAVTLNNVNRAFSNLESLFDEENPHKDKVVVFYKQGNDIKSKSNTEAGSITQVSKYNISITD